MEIVGMKEIYMLHEGQFSYEFFKAIGKFYHDAYIRQAIVSIRCWSITCNGNRAYVE
jgi:hypothetical protein